MVIKCLSLMPYNYSNNFDVDVCLPLPAVTALMIEFVIYRPSKKRIMPTYRKNTLKMTFHTSSLSYAQIPVNWSTGSPWKELNRSQKDVGEDAIIALPPPPRENDGEPTDTTLLVIEGMAIAPIPGPMAPVSASWGAIVATENGNF